MSKRSVDETGESDDSSGGEAKRSAGPDTESSGSNTAVVEAKGFKIFVGGLEQRVQTNDLTTYFQSYGKVIDSIVMLDRATGRTRGFGLVFILFFKRFAYYKNKM